MSDSERVIGIVGSGTMGAGIAQVAATAGFVVKTLDTDQQLVKDAYQGIRERLDRKLAKGKLSQVESDAIVERLHVAAGLSDIKDVECIIEAVPEDLALKRQIFSEIDRVVSPRTLLATNTSSLSIAKIADGLKNVDRFIRVIPSKT